MKLSISKTIYTLNGHLNIVTRCEIVTLAFKDRKQWVALKIFANQEPFNKEKPLVLGLSRHCEIFARVH